MQTDLRSKWPELALKRVFRIVNGATPKSDESTYWDGDIPWVTPDDLGALRVPELTSTQRLLTHEGYESCGTSLVSEGSLIVSSRAPIGYVAIAGTAVCTNQGCKALVPRRDLSALFFYYQLVAARHELESYGQGSTFSELAATKLGSIRLFVPPRPQQQAIAAFLDRETARIDALIAKKERLLGLLEEKRTALITRAVTKGLDPAVPMKESGVEWLGEVPAGWEVKRNKVLFREVRDLSEQGTEELLTVSHITGVTPRSEKQVYMFMAETTEGYKRCQKGDIVVNTMWAYMGALGVAPREGIVSPAYNVYRLKKGQLLPGYLDFLFRSPAYITQINQHSEGVWRSRLRLYPESFFRLRTPVPPIEEQERIVDRIRDLDSEQSPREIVLRRSVDLLREYRTAVISAAVTGQIEVAEHVA